MWVDCSTGRLGALRSVQLFLGLVKETGCVDKVCSLGIRQDDRGHQDY